MNVTSESSTWPDRMDFDQLWDDYDDPEADHRLAHRSRDPS